MKRFITLPNRRNVGLPAYVAAWKELIDVCKTSHGAQSTIRGFSDFPQSASDVLMELRAGLMDRINRHDHTMARGRKTDPDYQAGLMRDARRVRDVFAGVVVRQYESREVYKRFSHLLNHDD